MLDRLLKVGFDSSHGNPETFGNFTVWQAIDTRGNQHVSSPFGQFRDRAFEQVDLGAILDHARGVGSVIGDVNEAINLTGGQAAAFGPPAVAGDVERNAKQIGFGTPHRPDLVQAFEAEVCFVKHVGGKIRRAEAARQLSIEVGVISEQPIP